MDTEKKGKFSEVLGNWTKRDVSKNPNSPFIVRLGRQPCSVLRRKSTCKPEVAANDTVRGLKKQSSIGTDISEATKDSSGSSSPSTTTQSNRPCFGDRIELFEPNVSLWSNNKKNGSKSSQVASDQICLTSKNYEPVPRHLDAQTLLSDAKTTAAPKPRPSLKKQSSAQRSKRNHLQRKESRRMNAGKAVKRNKSNVCAHRMDSVNAFSPPVFEKDYAEKQLIYKVMMSNFVFEDLAPPEVKAFVQAFEKIEANKGQTIINQGDVGDFFYIIGGGTVTFEVNGRSVGSAEKGQSFGELALLYASPRSATVKATSEPTKLFRVDQKTFRYIMLSQTKELEHQKLDLLKKLPFLQDLVESDLLRLASAMTPRKFEEDDAVVRKGDIGHDFYVVHEGQLTVTDYTIGDTAYDSITLGPGDYFGERALVTSEPCAANVRGLTSGTVFSIDRYTFEKVLGSFSRAIMKSQDRSNLQGVSVFKDANLDTAKYELLAAQIVDKTYNVAETIFSDGCATNPAVYFIREGKVQLSSKDGIEGDLIEAGGYFGSDMLLADVRSQVSKSGTILADCTATVIGDTCTCGVLTLADCRLIVDTMKFSDPETSNLLVQDSLPVRARASKRFSTVVRDSLRSSINSQTSVDSLSRQSVLGEGQFGEVWLVSANYEDESESFALKIQSKEGPDSSDRLDEIRQEAAILQSLDHPCIVDLIQTYETDDLMYMLLGLVQGGELWALIHREDEDGNWTSGIPNDHAKFYGLIVADTLAYIHSQNIVFRDLKPENVLIDEDGYPIIVDFGFAKICTDKTYTLCGTPNYLAPEVITNRGHAAGVDHWALGVMIYEMLVGENPFFYEGLDQVSLFEAICHEDYFPLPNDISVDAFDLIDRLLEKDPTQRLGMLCGRERDILTHEWFHQLDLTLLQQKAVKAPYIPPPKGY